MATLQEIQRALINADKAGDTEAARALAAEYRRVEKENKSTIERSTTKELKPGESEQDFYRKNPGLSPTSAGSNFAAGYGKSAVDYGRGLGQMALDTALNEAEVPAMTPILGPLSAGRKILQQVAKPQLEAARQQLNENIAESRRMDAPLMKTTGGFMGNLTGNVINALPTVFVPGANTYGGAALTGGALSAMQPVTGKESRALNTGFGAISGIAARGLLDAAGAGYRGLKGIIQPFTKSGQETIAAQTIRDFAGNVDDATRNIQTAGELVPGSQPTLAEAANDAGISQLQRTIQNENPALSHDLAQRALQQNSARAAEMNTVTKYASNLDDAIKRRSEIGSKLYQKSFSQPIKVDKTITSLSERPSFQQALDRAQRIATEQGEPIGNLFDQQGKFASTKALHFVKMGYDDLINEANKPGMAIGNAELNSIKATRGRLIDWIAEHNKSYDIARTRFEKASRPINRQEIVNEIYSRATGRQLPNQLGEINISPSAFSGAMKNDGANVVRAATGREGKGLSDYLLPKQMEKLGNIKTDLARSANAQVFGKGVGSNTGQNIGARELLRQLVKRLPVIKGVTEMGQKNINQVLSQAVMNPSFAARLLSAPISQPSRLLPVINRLPGILGGGAVSAIR